MKGIKYIILALMLMALASCKQDNYYLFNDTSRIQFGPDITRIYTSSYNLVDTTKAFTFYYDASTTTQDTIFFDVYAIGGPSSKDRPFSLQQIQMTDGSTNALSGTDYKAFTDATVSSAYVIKAGQVHALVPIVMLRSVAQKTLTLTLKFQVAENTNFKLGDKANIWRKVTFTDRLSQPSAWTASMSQYYFGAYSVVKHAFMIQTTGQKWDQAFMLNVTADYNQMMSYVSQCKQALINYNNAHPGNSMKDENGVVIVFP
jgi:hypothetical protein